MNIVQVLFGLPAGDKHILSLSASEIAGTLIILPTHVIGIVRCLTSNVKRWCNVTLFLVPTTIEQKVHS